MKHCYSILLILTAFIFSSCKPSLMEMKKELDGITYYMSTVGETV